MGWLFLFIAALPIVEMALLIEIGRRIGALSAIALVVGTGMLGLVVARIQGFFLVQEMMSSLQRGEVPGNTIFDGVLLLVAAVFLVAPGVVTDLAGIALLVPPLRAAVRELLKSWLRRRLADGTLWIYRRY